MIKVRDLTKTFSNGDNVLYALNKVSFDINDKEFVVILGPSGSGKSTLLNTISGLESSDSGNIFYNQEDISRLSPKELTKFRRDKIGFIFQAYYLLPSLNVMSNIKMGGCLSKNKNFSDIIDALGLTGKERKFPGQLSGGEQQRVSIARALAKHPEILFCDEPTGALDEETGRLVLKYLMDIKNNSGLTVIMVTHNANFAKLATKVIRMNSGRIVEITYNQSPSTVEEIDW